MADASSAPKAQSEPAATPAPLADPALAENPQPGEKSDAPGADEAKATPPPANKLVDGPNPVEIPVARRDDPSNTPKPSPPKRPKDGSSLKPSSTPPKPAAAKSATTEPAFKGFQRKAAIQGSISRNGRSALNVVDSPLGRYQAVISRAVEQEWQRNCARHRDFITPGFLTVRFFVEASGRVRTVQFVGEMETGEVQKGFTLNSIRDAEIPAMPAALKHEYEKEPLELIFNFYF